MRNFKEFLQEENLPSFNWNTIKIINGKMLPNQFPNKVNIFSCSGLRKLTSLENSPQEANIFECWNTSITSLEHAPKIVNETFFCNSTKITSLEYAPLKCKYFFCEGNDIKSLQGIGKKYLKECDQIILPDSIESNILGLCLINKLKFILIKSSPTELINTGPLYEAIQIIKRHLQTDGAECMEELIQHGYKDYAKF